MADTSKLIRAIQAARRKVPDLLEDEVWRDWLQAKTLKRSLKEMSGQELGLVADSLNGRTFPYPQSPQMRRIRAMWVELAKAGVLETRADHALAAFIKRQTGQEIGFLPAVKANRVIEALSAIAARHGLLDERGYVDHRLATGGLATGGRATEGRATEGAGGDG